MSSSSSTEVAPSNKRFSSHRTSIDFFHHSKASKAPSKSSQESLVSNAATLEIEIESPPMVCYGTTTESSGALLSGQLWLSLASDLDFESLNLTFQGVVSTRRPVSAHCQDCSTKVTNLQEWKFLGDPHHIAKGERSYPFSYLFPGHLAASTVTALASIRYQLYAHGKTSSGQIVKATREISIARAILAGPDRHSLRIFPPTALSAALVLPSVVHRGGQFPIEMRLDGIVHKENLTRWRLRKLSWRIDEHSKVLSQPCKAHVAKIGGEGKAVMHEDSRTLSGREMKSGWKSDYSGDGRVEVLFQAGIPAGIPSADDVDSPAGITVSHNLVIEMIVAEEYIPKGTKMITPTGAARALRMQFNLTCTARAGLGISWEDECPPLYSDVPVSPPTYHTTIEDLDSISDSDEFHGL